MTDTAPETPKTRRWVMPVLFVSLALNLLVAGMFIGHAVSPNSPRFGDPMEGSARGVIGEPFIRALPEKDRRALFNDIFSDRDRIRESRDSLRARFDAFLAALRADPYDPDEVARLLLDQRQAAVRRQEIGEVLLLKRLEAMTADERSDYADRLEEALKRVRRR